MPKIDPKAKIQNPNMWGFRLFGTHVSHVVGLSMGKGLGDCGIVLVGDRKEIGDSELLRSK